MTRNATWSVPRFLHDSVELLLLLALAMGGACTPRFALTTARSPSPQLQPALVVGAGDHLAAAASADGTLHIVSGRWHRFGTDIHALSPPLSLLPDSFDSVLSNPRVHLDSRGQLHLVFQRGRYGRARECWYSCWNGLEWSAPYCWAKRNDTNGLRAYIPDVTADTAGNVLLSYTDFRSTGATMSGYRWRSAAGAWSGLHHVDFVKSGHSTPKVAWTPQGFYLLYHGNPADSLWEWYLSGPAPFNTPLAQGRPLNTAALGLGGQNEGGTVDAINDSVLIATSNIMESKGWWVGRAGLWVSTIAPGGITTQLVGFVDSTTAHDGGTFSPHIAFDKHSGTLVLSFLIKERAFYTLKTPQGWTPFARIYPEAESVQGSIRNNPVVVDVPGAGVLFCFRSDSTVMVRKLLL